MNGTLTATPEVHAKIIGYRLQNRMSFMVRLPGECINVKPTFSFCLMKRNGTKSTLSNQHMKIESNQYFEFAAQKSPFQEQVFAYGDHSTLSFEKYFVNDGSFEFICSIDNTDVPIIRCFLGVPKSFDLQSQIGNLLKSSDSTDVTFDVGNRSFMCHRLILATRSPVFKAELYGNMAEATQQHIKIEDIFPDIFEAMLHFVYTDSFSCCDSEKTSVKMAQHLFVAADRYAIGGLKALCEDKLFASISLDTVGSTLALAEQHNCPRLKSACIEFIAKVEQGSLINWLLTDEYVDLVRSFPSLMAEVRTKVNT